MMQSCCHTYTLEMQSCCHTCTRDVVLLSYIYTRIKYVTTTLHTTRVFQCICMTTTLMMQSCCHAYTQFIIMSQVVVLLSYMYQRCSLGVIHIHQNTLEPRTDAKHTAGDTTSLVYMYDNNILQERVASRSVATTQLYSQLTLLLRRAKSVTKKGYDCYQNKERGYYPTLFLVTVLVTTCDMQHET